MSSSKLFCTNRFAKCGLVVLFFIFGIGNVYAQPEPLSVWDFNEANPTAATIGDDLELQGSHFSIGGIDASDGAVAIFTGSYYRAYHGAAANGGGSYVNQYSLVIDFKVPELGSWYSFFNTSENNSNDGDAFVNPDGNIGVGATGYSESAIEAGLWNRLIIAVDNAAGTFQYFMNGNLILDGEGQGVDGRFSIYTSGHDTPWVILFGDDNGDDATIYVSHVAFYDSALNADDAAALGGPAGLDGPVEGEPVDIPSVPPMTPEITAIGPENPSGLDNVTLTASEFNSPNDAAHTKSRWQLSFDPSFEENAEADMFLLRDITSEESLSSIEIENSLLPFNTPVYVRVQYIDDLETPSDFSEPFSFTLAVFDGLKEIYRQDFEDTPVDQLPEGWKAVNFSTPPEDAPSNVDEPTNEQLEGWSVQEGSFLETLTYYPSADPLASFIGGPHMEDKRAHADSANYIYSFQSYYETHMISEEIDLSGVENVYIAFESDHVQNQDTIAVAEYTTDGGDVSDTRNIEGTWYPIVYIMEQGEIIADDEGNPDANFTFDQEVPETGGRFYDEYVFATQSLPLFEWEPLSPHIMPDIDDDPKNGKRFIKARLEEADNQTIKLHFGFVGSWSWYWGVDDIVIYGDDGTKINEWSLY